MFELFGIGNDGMESQESVSPAEKTTEQATESTSASAEIVRPAPELFDRARLIAYRAAARRQFSRATSII